MLKKVCKGQLTFLAQAGRWAGGAMNRRAMMDTTALTLILSPETPSNSSVNNDGASARRDGQLFSPVINFNESGISTSNDASSNGSKIIYLENEIDRLKNIISEITEVNALRIENSKLKQIEAKLNKTVIENEKLRVLNARLTETYIECNSLLDDFGVCIGGSPAVANSLTREKYVDESQIFHMIKDDDFKSLVEKINSNTFKQLHKQYQFRPSTVPDPDTNEDEQGFLKEETLLICACRLNNYRIASMLIKRGINIDATTEVGSTALIHVASRGYYPIAKLLLENNCDVDKTNVYNYNALQIAGYHGYNSLCSLLLDYGASINMKGFYGCTPLLFACQRAHLNLAIMLIDKGADTTLRTSDGQSFIDVYGSRLPSPLLPDDRVRQLSLLQGARDKAQAWSRRKHFVFFLNELNIGGGNKPSAMKGSSIRPKTVKFSDIVTLKTVLGDKKIRMAITSFL